MLNINGFRTIKPTGSVDKCESCFVAGETNAQKSKRFVQGILELLKEKPLSIVDDMVIATGASKGSIYAITTRMLEAGLVIRVKAENKGSIKAPYLYSLPE